MAIERAHRSFIDIRGETHSKEVGQPRPRCRGVKRSSFIQKNTYFIHLVPGTILGTRYTSMNKTDKNPCPHEVSIPVEEKDNK